MPLSTSLRKLLCCAPVRQEEEEAPARRPLPEPMEAAPEPEQAGSAQAGRPYRGYVESEVDRRFGEMIDELEELAERKKIPLPEHPAPHHPPIRFSTDPDSGRPIPDEDALIRGDYVYVPEDGSRITRDEFIRPWRVPGVIPIEDNLISRGLGRVLRPAR